MKTLKQQLQEADEPNLTPEKALKIFKLYLEQKRQENIEDMNLAYSPLKEFLKIAINQIDELLEELKQC